MRSSAAGLAATVTQMAQVAKQLTQIVSVVEDQSAETYARAEIGVTSAVSASGAAVGVAVAAGAAEEAAHQHGEIVQTSS